MEFVDLSRYLEVKNPKIPPFSDLKKTAPVWLTWDLKLSDEPENITHATSLAEKGFEVVPIKRHPPLSKYQDREDFPRRILFEMTSRCNFLCRMCPQQNLKRPRMDMPGELYRKVIDEIDQYGVEGLWIYHLGESLLHPEFEENIEHISKKKNLGVIWMSTNGQYFDEEHIRTVLDSNMDFINFSAHAITEETYRKVAPKGDFNVVQGNLEKLYEIKGNDNIKSRQFINCQMIE
jgi:MoaA/NifB/PqqE/SkfB family radical SAM enzyme